MPSPPPHVLASVSGWMLLVFCSGAAAAPSGQTRAIPLPAQGPVRLLEGPGGQVLAACGDGLYRATDTRFERLVPGPLRGAAVAPDGKAFFTRDTKVFSGPLSRPAQAEDVTDSFGAAPGGEGRVVCTPDGTMWVEGCPNRRTVDGTYVPVPKPPAGATAPVPMAVDTAGNLWTLLPTADGKAQRLAVLPAQAPSGWRLEAHTHIAPGDWRQLLADDFGGVWLAGRMKLLRLVPSQVDRGWTEVTRADGLPDAEITALALSARGQALVGFASGARAECDVLGDGERRVQVQAAPGPGGAAGPVRALLVDSTGRQWTASGARCVVLDAPADAWQRAWQAGGRLPFANHDVSGATIAGRFYVPGGASYEFGYPAEPRVFDQVFAYDPALHVWRISGRLSRPRAFAASAAMGRRLWVIGGRQPGEDGKPRATDGVEIFDSLTGRVSPGPSLPAAMATPVAGVVGKRVYVVGDSALSRNGATVVSIAEGERQWRRERDAPFRFGHAPGCTAGGTMYVAVSRRGLVALDVASGTWRTDLAKPDFPRPPRCPQIAAVGDAVWVLGGRDVPQGTEVSVYSPGANRWSPRPGLPLPAAWGAAGVVGGRLFVAAGAAARPPSQRNYFFTNRSFLARPALHEPRDPPRASRGPLARVCALKLTGGLPEERDVEVYLALRGEAVRRAFALAPRFNKISYAVDASEISAAKGRLAGSIRVTITSDGYNPPVGCTDVCVYAIDAEVAGGKVVGAFNGTCERTGKPAPSRKKGEAPAPPMGLQKTQGEVTGTVTVGPKWGRAVRFVLYLDNARAQSAAQPNRRTRTLPRWNLPGFLRLTTADGHAAVATLRGFGGHPINYFQAEVTGTDVTFSGDQLAGTVEAVGAGRAYRFTLAADVIGDRLAGTFAKLVDGKPGVAGRLHGVLEDVTSLRPSDAVYYLVLDGAVAARDRKTGTIDRRQMILHVPCVGGAFREGVGFAGTYNHTYYDVASTGLNLAADRLTGALKVTVHADPYVPPDGKAVPCTYSVDAKVVDSSVSGSFTGTFGPHKVSGRLAGELRRRPSVPEPMHVSLKLDNGAAGVSGGPAWHRRCYVDFTAASGKASEGSFSNNKGGFKGRFLRADVQCDSSTFTATIEAAVDESRTVKVGRHTFRLVGKVVGLEIVGRVETLFEGRPWKKNTAFIGTIRPAPR